MIRFYAISHAITLVNFTEACLPVFADDEYRSLVDKYAKVRDDFEQKMGDSCQVSRKLSYSLYTLYI